MVKGIKLKYQWTNYVTFGRYNNTYNNNLYRYIVGLYYSLEILIHTVQRNIKHDCIGVPLHPLAPTLQTSSLAKGKGD